MASTFMEKSLDKLTEVVGPLSEKIAKYKYLMALSESMQALLPITIVGSFACLFAFIDIGGYQAFLMEHMQVFIFFMTVQSLTLSIFSLYYICVVSYQFAKKLGMRDPISAVPLSVASFLVLTPTVLYTNIPSQWLGHSGLFSAMIVSFVVPKIIKLFIDKNITIKMPAGVPRMVENAFTVMIPAIVIVFSFAAIGVFFQNTKYESFHNLIYTFIQAPLKDIGLSLPVYILYQILMTVFMFCGIHGSTAVAWMSPIFTAATQENLAAWTAGEALPNIIAGAFENCILIGGIGATLGAGLVLFIFAKSKRYRQLSKIAIIPQIFNIGEPLLFGIPIMLNPLLFIPYMGGVLINTVLVYSAVATGLVGRFTGVTIPWTLQGILGGLLGNSVPWQGALLQAFILVLDMVIWFPFIKIIDRKALAEEKAAEEAEAAKAVAEAA